MAQRKYTIFLATMLGAFALAVCAATGAAAQEPSGPKELVRVTVEKVRQTVRDKKATATPEQLDKELFDIIAPVFDFQEMSRLCLGANWKKADEAQRKEFVDLFSNLLAKNYLKQIRKHADNSTFAILSEKNIAKNKRLIRTKVNYDQDQTASIDYRLRESDGSWRVYDVIIENIGLVSNYRSEFAGIVQNEKIDGLLRRLRSKK